MTIGQAVLNLRQALNLSQAGLADHLGRHLNSVRNWEAGVVPTPVILVDLYREAQKIGRSDLASAFAVVGAGAVAGDHHALLAQMLPGVQECFSRGASLLTRCLAEHNIAPAKRGALVGEALAEITEGRDVLERIIRQAHGWQADEAEPKKKTPQRRQRRGA